VDEGTVLRKGMKEVDDICRQDGWERMKKKRGINGKNIYK
jgi:hypothetical protein